MARSSNPYKGDFAGALSFLQSVGKDVSRIKTPDYAERLAGKIDRQLGEGKAANFQAARWHAVTPEHPGRKSPGHAGYQSGLTQQQRAERPQGASLTLPNGAVIVSGHTKSVGRRVVRLSEQMGGGTTLESGQHNGNIKISYVGKDGKRHELFSHGGIKPERLKSAMAEYGSLGGAVSGLAGEAGIYGEDDDAMPDYDAEFDFYID